MTTLLAGIIALLLLFVLSEIVSAVPTFRFAVTMRRQERRLAREAAAARDPRRNPYAHLNAYFADIPGDAPLNQPYDCAETGLTSPVSRRRGPGWPPGSDS